MTAKLSRTSCPIIFKTRQGIELHRPRPGLCNDVALVTSDKAAAEVAAWIRANVGSMPDCTKMVVTVTSEKDNQ